MKRTIKEVYDLIKEKMNSAEKCYRKVEDYGIDTSYFKGETNAYYDVLCLIESSHLLEEDKPINSYLYLEAFNKIKNTFAPISNNFKTVEQFKKISVLLPAETHNVEFALERLRKYDLYEIDLLNANKQTSLQVTRKLKVLEIIKNKKVNVKELKKCDSVGKYNYRIYKEEEKLTQEDFDLLKEVLL